MALKILKATETGITTEYHKIGSISLDSTKGKLTATVRSYTAQDYRQNEKDYETARTKRETDMTQIEAELAKSEGERDTKLIKNLTEQSNELLKQLDSNLPNNETKKLYVLESTYEFDFNSSDIISYSSIYSILKTLDEFKDAEDV